MSKTVVTKTGVNANVTNMNIVVRKLISIYKTQMDKIHMRLIAISWTRNILQINLSLNTSLFVKLQILIHQG